MNISPIRVSGGQYFPGLEQIIWRGDVLQGNDWGPVSGLADGVVFERKGSPCAGTVHFWCSSTVSACLVAIFHGDDIQQEMFKERLRSLG